MASRDPISDDPGRPERPARTPAERTPPPLEYRPPPTTVPTGRSAGFWAVVIIIIALIVVGLLFWSGIL